jgi:hypothetical protein
LDVWPLVGVAMVTNFSLVTSNWTDPEADLPLSYRCVLWRGMKVHGEPLDHQ